MTHTDAVIAVIGALCGVGWHQATEWYLAYRNTRRMYEQAQDEIAQHIASRQWMRDRICQLAAVADAVPALREERDEMMAELDRLNAERNRP